MAKKWQRNIPKYDKVLSLKKPIFWDILQLLKCSFIYLFEYSDSSAISQGI